MLSQLPTKLGLQLNRILSCFGVMLIRYPTPADKRRHLLMQRYRISTVLDIGANCGQYALRLRELGYRGQIISLEPLPDAYKVLKKKTEQGNRWHAINKAVSDQETDLELHIAANSESSSLLPMLPRHLQAARNSGTIGKTRVRTVTLASLLEPLTKEEILIKIDTQGHEGSILNSGLDLLSRTALIEVEMSLVPLYEGQALFHEIDQLLTQRGFKLVSMQDGFYDPHTGELLQLDALYENTLLID